MNLTTMLVMTTIFIAVMDKLPSTAYIKMIDIWLIFGQLIPFARVVITTVMEQLRNGSDRLVNHHGTAMELDMDNTSINVIGIAGNDEKLPTRHQLALTCWFWILLPENVQKVFLSSTNGLSSFLMFF